MKEPGHFLFEKKKCPNEQNRRKKKDRVQGHNSPCVSQVLKRARMGISTKISHEDRTYKRKTGRGAREDGGIARLHHREGDRAGGLVHTS